MGKTKFRGEELETSIKRLPRGKSQMDAYLNAIRAGGRGRGSLLAAQCSGATTAMRPPSGTIRPRPSRWRRGSAHPFEENSEAS